MFVNSAIVNFDMACRYLAPWLTPMISYAAWMIEWTNGMMCTNYVVGETTHVVGEKQVSVQDSGMYHVSLDFCKLCRVDSAFGGGGGMQKI
jgi:hypothetical protein